jgi:hypothetical protein
MWKEGLAPIDHVHHQIGNLVVNVTGDVAHATCHGIALHHRRIASPGRTRVFVGSYRIHLVRLDGAWRIDRFTFTSRLSRRQHGAGEGDDLATGAGPRLVPLQLRQG